MDQANIASLMSPLPEALSPWTMFMKADIVVQAVMIGLVLASVATWTVLVVKTIQLRSALRKGRSALSMAVAARSLSDATGRVSAEDGVVGRLLATAEDEIDKSRGLPADGIKERVSWQFERIEAAAVARIGRGIGILATVGAVAPFVGLFGTVWGIMNSFIGISRSQTTNLAVVAPGIAEALLATAIGLAAAIPAVIIYNHFSRVTKGYLELVNRAAGATGRLLSRDLDRGSRDLDRGARDLDRSQIGIHARAAE